MERSIPEAAECDLSIPIPRGGPIYVPNMVGPSTRVPHFQTCLLSELRNLEAELSEDFSHLDISVDDLKIFTEDDLMDMALKEVFQGRENDENHPPLLDQPNASRFGEKKSNRKRKGTNDSVLELGLSSWCYMSADHQSDCIEKVEQVVRIKQKQEEDKASVKLHSFDRRINEAVHKSTRTERMRTLRSTSSTRKVNTASLQEHLPVLYPEVVLSVEVYHNVRKGTKIQELLVLGGQTLTALRDKIFCSTDQVMHKAGQHDPSGYFLIEDVFCPDLRDPSAIDLTRPILDWLRDSKEEAQKKWEYIITGELQKKQKAIMGEKSASQLPHFRSIEMHKIRFCDLSFQLGAGYLYCHQGDCTHTLVIRDMRLIHPEDVHNRAVYPIITFQLKLRFQKCNVCKIFRATKVTVDDKWTPENPCYFCDECFSLLHQADDGTLLYTDFVEYDYNHD
ncbi:snRNA-activating protein complex subunit [Glycine max]|uniref:snRNA-activating protein complex subunit isoform X1 n=1 Tax=Glycine max TaxID=3847 RepID=UPI0007193450|nr:snRNA-activating protein complex subunit isoform X1 [Glycine max]XP_014633770.1 snRNA-activating protein complex subunit isoform X1 [Glycine max]XP_028241976.1 snRNA-activating protein complex subunit isoform X1 [Glycine soja]XP_028241977.1 snRNA-activating protein complex subunit isoform X1 [Glycine soja]KAH1243910.1 snRNA-activating protein complex subunit [Glycine max]KAH1243911.1 snRNA-activating protein complex subunit [Glycine max]|eukprot:XP_014633769.1 snRNA-activating protein complex subunit isoform X1 [Glycine max]